jgi:hypothetical protein
MVKSVSLTFVSDEPTFYLEAATRSPTTAAETIHMA